MESTTSPRLQEPAALNISSRINSALDAIDLGLQRSQRPILTTKFGPLSAVLLHLVSQVKPDIPVIWVNTGFNTDATLSFAEEVSKLLTLNWKTYVPTTPWDREIPETTDPEFLNFSERVKLEPFRRALSDFEPDVWITALRREQTEFRDGLSLFQREENDILKVCPLLDWRGADMQAYLALHQLPDEPDYHDPVKAKPHLECGIHNRL